MGIEMGDRSDELSGWEVRKRARMTLVQERAALEAWGKGVADERAQLELEQKYTPVLRELRARGWTLDHLHDACVAIGAPARRNTDRLEYFRCFAAAVGPEGGPCEASLHALKDAMRHLRSGGVQLSLQGGKERLVEHLRHLIGGVLEPARVQLREFVQAADLFPDMKEEHAGCTSIGADGASVVAEGSADASISEGDFFEVTPCATDSVVWILRFTGTVTCCCRRCHGSADAVVATFDDAIFERDYWRLFLVSSTNDRALVCRGCRRAGIVAAACVKNGYSPAMWTVGSRSSFEERSYWCSRCRVPSATIHAKPAPAGPDLDA